MSARTSVLSISLLGCLTTQSALAQGQSAGSAARVTLSGVVTDDGNVPIASAELMLARKGESNRLLRTGNDGRFAFEGVSAGPVSLTARRLGYRARTLQLEINAAVAPTPLSFILQSVAEDVAPVYVEGSDNRLDVFYAHKRQSNFGRFVERAEIERKGPIYLSELFRTIPGATVKASGRAGNTVRLRGCQPMIWLDGMRVPNAELDDIANPMDIGGIEIYTSWSALPGEYMDRDAAGCGAIVVWTKSR
jgi:Carboxypeptidase regulatory-like domain/TonB-dependent Receptor Plug Domain